MKVEDGGRPGDFQQLPLVRLADGITPSSLEWPDLGYASAYAKSYEIFTRLSADRIIPPGVRFQVEYPTPLAPVRSWIATSQQDELLDPYERALFSDLQQLLALVPHDQIAVQWDVAVEFGILEDARGTAPPRAFDEIVAGLARCVGQVPSQAQVGLHLCYGDYGHRHLVEPSSLATQVRVLNAVSAAAPRAINFAAFTVPQCQRDADYFAPLRELRVDDQSELYFALVPYHPADQEPGTTVEQIRLIDRFLTESPTEIREWGICTECGMGRVEREEVPVLLDLHRTILAAH